MLMKSQTEKFFEEFVKEILDKNKISYTKLSIIKLENNRHHQDLSIVIVYPKSDLHPYGRQHAISFKCMPTGCGLMSMYNFGSCNKYNTSESSIRIFKECLTVFGPVVEGLCDYFHKDGAGTIIATKGSTDHDTNDFLLAMKFKPIYTYDNLAHGRAMHKQTLWARTVTFKEYLDKIFENEDNEDNNLEDAEYEEED